MVINFVVLTNAPFSHIWLAAHFCICLFVLMLQHFSKFYTCAVKLLVFCLFACFFFLEVAVFWAFRASVQSLWNFRARLEKKNVCLKITYHTTSWPCKLKSKEREKDNKLKEMPKMKAAFSFCHKVKPHTCNAFTQNQEIWTYPSPWLPVELLFHFQVLRHQTLNDLAPANFYTSFIYAWHGS